MSDELTNLQARLPDLDSPTYADEMTANIRKMRANIPKDMKIPKPRDAATIIITRKTASGPEVLMGRRHANHKFLPNAFVFPGGRVDTGDLRAFPGTALSPATAAKVESYKGAKARALGLAGIRETFEETGIVIGRPLGAARPPRVKSEAWRPFLATGHVPALESLDLIFRAITPPHHFKRFDTWFFAVDIETVPAAATPIGTGSGELEELQWVGIDDTARLTLVSVTYAVLSALKKRYSAGSSVSYTIPFTRFLNNKFVLGEV